MKQGKTLQELAAEVQRVSDSKKDYVADTRDMKMRVRTASDQDFARLIDRPVDLDARTEEAAGARPVINVAKFGDHQINPVAHGQLAAWAKIPKGYYDRMLVEAPHLLASNVNHWFTSGPKRRMVRTLDEEIRAFLSDRYRVIDNDELLASVLPILGGLNVSIESCDLTNRKIYLKCTFPKVEGEVKKGDVVRAGFVLSNSEVGLGGVNVQPIVYRLVCLNGATMNDLGMKKYHVGRIQGEGKNAQRFFKDDTLKADDEAFMLKVRDTVKGAASEANLKYMIGRMQEATERKIEGNPVEAIELVKKKYSLLDTEKDGVLRHLIKGGDLSQYGVGNAITRASQDIDDYDRASDLERFGGKVFEMGASEFKDIAKAA